MAITRPDGTYSALSNIYLGEEYLHTVLPVPWQFSRNGAGQQTMKFDLLLDVDTGTSGGGGAFDAGVNVVGNVSGDLYPLTYADADGVYSIEDDGSGVNGRVTGKESPLLSGSDIQPRHADVVQFVSCLDTSNDAFVSSIRILFENDSNPADEVDFHAPGVLDETSITEDDWTHFDEGRSCSAYLMRQLVANNINAVTVRSKPSICNLVNACVVST